MFYQFTLYNPEHSFLKCLVRHFFSSLIIPGKTGLGAWARTGGTWARRRCSRRWRCWPTVKMGTATRGTTTTPWCDQRHAEWANEKYFSEWWLSRVVATFVLIYFCWNSIKLVKLCMNYEIKYKITQPLRTIYTLRLIQIIYCTMYNSNGYSDFHWQQLR